MFDRPESGNRALIVQIDFGEPDQAERLSEIVLLAESAGAEVLGTIQARRRAPDPAMFVGKGKVEEIAAIRTERDADLILFNHELSPGQQRNLERALQCRVVDLMDVLDTPDEHAAADLDLLTRLRTPGAMELLDAYERLAPESRASLVTLLRTLTPHQPTGEPA